MTSISELNIATATHNCLLRNRISTVEDLECKSKQELLNLKDFQQKYLEDVESALKEYNLEKE